MSVHCRDGIYSVHYLDNTGKQRSKSCGKGDEGKRKAEALNEQIKAAKQARKEAERASLFTQEPVIPFPVPEQKNENLPLDNKPVITFGQMVKEFLADSKIKGSTEDHRRDIAYVSAKLFLPHFGKDTPIREITYADIVDFMAKICEEPSRNGRQRSVITINQYGHFLKAFFNYAVDLEYIDKSPMRRWKPMKTPPTERKLTPEDLQKIKDNAAPHLKWALEVEYNLGLRTGPSELLSLQWENIDFEKKEVRVYGRKTKKYRTIPIRASKFAEFLEHLKERKQQARTPYVVEYEGCPVKSLKRSFNKAVERAGITYPVRMYDVRHLFATTLISKGATIGAVSKLMGHSRTSTTVNVYYHASREETEKAMEKLPTLKS